MCVEFRQTQSCGWRALLARPAARCLFSDLLYGVIGRAGRATTSSTAGSDRTGISPQHRSDLHNKSVTTARQFTRKDSPPALLYVHRTHTPPTPPLTARKGAFQGQSPTKYLVDPVKHYQHRTIIPLEGGHGSTLSGTIATMASATAACLFLAATPDLLALARGGADKGSAEAIAWTLGTALGLKYVAARA